MKELIQALRQHYALLEELLALLKRETDEMTSVHIDAMTEINTMKDEIAARIQAHAPTLQQAIRVMAVQEHLPQDSTLGDIAERVQKRGQTELPRLHRDINALAGQVRMVAEMNREIAERFSETVTQSLEFFSRMLKQSNMYAATGGYQKRPTAAVMINMEA